MENSFILSILILNIFVICFITLTESQSTTDTDVTPETHPNQEIEDILVWKGYMERGAGSNETAMQEALELYQAYMDIQVTGKMNEDTWSKMHEPQCGNPDIINRDSLNGMARRKRYAVTPNFWPRTRLTYRFLSVPSVRGGNEAQAVTEIERALRVWSEVSQLEFVKRNEGRVDILISTQGRVHDEPVRAGNGGFDGPGMVLAHAYFPRVGDIHFDNDERWILDLNGGTNLFLVAAHEIGHSLGLGHSIQGSLMHGSYNRRLSLTQPLHEDDIMGIQSLYGPRRVTNIEPRRDGRPRPVSNTVAPPPNLCTNPSVDAITSTHDGMVYVFKDEYYWNLDTTGLSEPRQIDDDWPGFTGKVDAAITAPDGDTFLIQGNTYRRFKGRIMSGAETPISSTFGGITGPVDAAFVWPVDGRLHFIKGTGIWRYQYNGRYNARRVTFLRNLGILDTTIDAAFTFNFTKTYFVSGDHYYRMRTNPARVDVGFPKNLATGLFGCNSDLNPESGRNGKLLNDLGDDVGNIFGHVFDKGFTDPRLETPKQASSSGYTKAHCALTLILAGAVFVKNSCF